MAAFHTGFLVTSLVTLLHWYGGLGNALRDLSTLSGVVIFLALWLATWWCTRRALRRIPAGTHERAVPAGTLVPRGILWGGVNGVMFLAVLAVLFGLSIDDPRIGVFFSVLGSLIFSLPFGSILAFTVGACVGGVFAWLDFALLEASRRLFLGCTEEK